jgi:hypothetical protein
VAGRQTGAGVAGRGGDRETEIPDPAMERPVGSRAAIHVPRGLNLCFRVPTQADWTGA